MLHLGRDSPHSHHRLGSRPGLRCPLLHQNRSSIFRRFFPSSSRKHVPLFTPSSLRCGILKICVSLVTANCLRIDQGLANGSPCASGDDYGCLFCGRTLSPTAALCKDSVIDDIRPCPRSLTLFDMNTSAVFLASNGSTFFLASRIEFAIQDCLMDLSAPLTGNQNRGPTLVIVIWILAGLALIVVSIKIYTRIKIIREPVLDDVFTVLAVVSGHDN